MQATCAWMRPVKHRGKLGGVADRQLVVDNWVVTCEVYDGSLGTKNMLYNLEGNLPGLAELVGADCHKP
jgi:hypothetical protein